MAELKHLLDPVYKELHSSILTWEEVSERSTRKCEIRRWPEGPKVDVNLFDRTGDNGHKSVLKMTLIHTSNPILQ